MLKIEIPGYRIQRPLGRGGMAGVYLAEQLSLNRDVALKLLSPALAADDDFVERFKGEARMVAQLNHPNIVAIYDIGVVEKQLYLALEYIAGGDLRDRLKSGALAPKKAFRVVSEVAKALKRAHGANIVHRDIKPENILFRAEGEAVVGDFGIAKALGTDAHLTQTGLVVGSPYYMSPEQGKGQAIDGRTDLYSLGVVLYEMLTGRVPYEAPDTFSLALKHFVEPIPSLPAKLAIYQPLLDRVMAKEPEDRFPNADALLEAIEGLDYQPQFDAEEQTTQVFPTPLGASSQVQPTPVAAATGGQEVVEPAPSAAVEPSDETVVLPATPVTREPGPSRWIYAVAGAGLLAAIGVGWMITRPGPGQDGGSAPLSEVKRVADGAPNGSATAKSAQAAGAQEQPEPVQADAAPTHVAVSHQDTKPTASDAEPSAPLPEMVTIAAGCYQMGSPESDSARESDELNHKVCVKPFELGRYEVSVGEFDRFVAATSYQTDAERNAGDKTGCRAVGEPKGGDPWNWREWANWRHTTRAGDDPHDHAVGCLSWNDVQAYIAWLNQQSGQSYRLPTEAEWEYAARAGTESARYWGDEPKDACQYANVADQTELPNSGHWQGGHDCSDGQAFGAKVGQYQPNAWGLHDMLGNLWEWTCTPYQSVLNGEEQRCQSTGAGSMVVRGGGWNNDPRWARSANRSQSDSVNRFANVGFRLAKDQ